MSLFDSLGNNQMARLQANPSEMLKQAGYTVPQEMKDPKAIVQHLIQSGQINNSKLQYLMQFMK